MNKKPLIRRSYKFADIIKIIFSKIFGKNAKKQLVIQKVGKEIHFHSFTGDLQWDNFPNKISEDVLLSSIKKSELRGMGGAGYPVFDKLSKVLESSKSENATLSSPILIINAVECDPGLQHDNWIIENRMQQLQEIISLLKETLKLNEIFMASKNSVNFKDCTNIEIPDSYPAGEEKNLVENILGLDKASYNYPSEKGIWIQNIQTLLSIHAILCSRDIPKYLTMQNLDSGESVVIEYFSNKTVSELVEPIFPGYTKIYTGGGIMQAMAVNKDDFVNSTTNMIAVGKVADFPNEECHHCKQCNKYCNAEIDLEASMNQVSKGEKLDKLITDSCKECGACSYICPSGKDICSIINSMN